MKTVYLVEERQRNGGGITPIMYEFEINDDQTTNDVKKTVKGNKESRYFWYEDKESAEGMCESIRKYRWI